MTAHTGVGGILTARRAGHRPLVVTGLRRLGELLGDHQEALTRRPAALRPVEAQQGTDEVAGALARVTAGHRLSDHEPNALYIAVRDALLS